VFFFSRVRRGRRVALTLCSELFQNASACSCFSVSQGRETSWLASPWWTATGSVCWTTWWDLRTEYSTTSPSRSITLHTHTHTHTHIHTLASLKTTTNHCVKKLQPMLVAGCVSDRFSGITRKMLRPITMTLRDVRLKLVNLLPSDAVLVGHSLESDLVALKVSESVCTRLQIEVCVQQKDAWLSPFILTHKWDILLD